MLLDILAFLCCCCRRRNGNEDQDIPMTVMEPPIEVPYGVHNAPSHMRDDPNMLSDVDISDLSDQTPLPEIPFAVLPYVAVRRNPNSEGPSGA